MLLFDSLPKCKSIYKEAKWLLSPLWRNNSCEVALGQHRYNEHHDEVLQSTANAVAKKPPTTTTITTTTNFTANLEAT